MQVPDIFALLSFKNAAINFVTTTLNQRHRGMQPDDQLIDFNNWITKLGVGTSRKSLIFLLRLSFLDLC